MRCLAEHPRLEGLICIGWALWLLTVTGCRSALELPPPARVPTDVEQPSYDVALPVIAFTIQVGAFSTAERASDYADRLASFGLDTYYFIDTDGLCKVRFDRFETKAEARRRAQELKDRGQIEDY